MHDRKYICTVKQSFWNYALGFVESMDVEKRRVTCSDSSMEDGGDLAEKRKGEQNL